MVYEAVEFLVRWYVSGRRLSRYAAELYETQTLAADMVDNYKPFKTLPEKTRAVYQNMVLVTATDFAHEVLRQISTGVLLGLLALLSWKVFDG